RDLDAARFVERGRQALGIGGGAECRRPEKTESKLAEGSARSLHRYLRYGSYRDGVHDFLVWATSGAGIMHAARISIVQGLSRTRGPPAVSPRSMWSVRERQSALS